MTTKTNSWAFRCWEHLPIRHSAFGFRLSLCAAFCLLAVPARAATNDLTTALQRGLFEEEANQNLAAAVQAYQTVAGQFDKDRKLAATAIFRLGECYRKQGNANDAAAQYERILREFSDQPVLVTLSRQSLAAMGSALPAPATSVLSDAARLEQKRLLEEEIKLVEKEVEKRQAQVKARVVSSEDLLATQRDLLHLKLQMAALDAGLPAATASSDAAASAAVAEAEAVTLEAQIAELKTLPKDKLRIAVQQNFPNPVLTSLMQKLTEAEQRLTGLQKEYGPEHTEVVKAQALVATINQQIDDQGEAVLGGLQIKLKAARKTAETLLAQLGTAAPKADAASSSASVPTTASEAEEVKRIQAMIKDSPDLINAKSTAPGVYGTTPLHTAAAQGQLIVAEFLLANGADIAAKDNMGGTPLHAAARGGHKSMVELLLNHQASVQAVDNDGFTPLHLAAQHGYRSVVETLLAHAADVNAKDKDGATPLLLAAAYGFTSVAELLLAHGADINATTSHIYAGNMGFSGTPLCIAATRGDAPLVELLLAKGAQVNAEDKDGQTPLSCAAQAHSEPAVKLLLAAHADPNAGRLNLPLAMAAYQGDIPILKLLLANGADPNTNSKINWRVNTRRGDQSGNFTPLFLAVSQRHPAAAEELLRFKADPSAPGPDGNPLLFEALPDAPTVKVLLEGGADPNVRTSDGTPLLLHAVVDKNQPAVELLLAHHADVDAEGPQVASNPQSFVWAPLDAAAWRGYKAIAELLLKAGADVNVRDQDGNTPLILAVRQGQPELAELLLANKADPNARNNTGQTPLDVAKSQTQSPQRQLPRGPGNPMPVGIPAARPHRQVPGTAATAPGQEAKPETMADLLRQHGALDDLLRLDGIGVGRDSTGHIETAFAKGAHDWNQFTLLELIGVQYSFLAASPNQEEQGGTRYWSSSFARQFGANFPFPDLAHLRIRRPAPDQKSWLDRTVDLRPVLQSGDCSKDARLEWGDVVEIPEADHPLNEQWPGFSRTELANLLKCLTRRVEIVINGQATNITLTPQINLEGASMGLGGGGGVKEPVIVPGEDFWLKPVLLQSKLVLTSSDLRHVKVTRHNVGSGQQREWVVDCSGNNNPNLWLRDGDKVEVPEKSAASSAAEAEAPPPPATWIGPGPITPAPAKQMFTQRLKMISRTPAPETPQTQGIEEQYLNISGVLYSPKPNDPALHQAGYHRDHRVTTRKAECWEQRSSAPLAGRGGNTIWTGADMIEFGGEGMGTSYGDGASYCFAEDTWSPLPLKGAPRPGHRDVYVQGRHTDWPEEDAPSSRSGHAMVWTGKEMIVWGGFGGMGGNDTLHNDGARYNPSSDTWKPVSEFNAPSARVDFPAVWTGREMLFWGGFTDTHSRYQGFHAHAHLKTGGRYNPSADSWKTITTQGAPSKRCGHTLVWTGKEAIIWGGCNATKALNDGARYNPARDAWEPVSADGAPSPRLGQVAFWTGKEMLVWGGTTRETDTEGVYFENGACYNPDTDTWRPISTIGAPKGRVGGVAVWTGTEMIVWGGANDAQAREGAAGFDPNRYIGTGARYNPATDTWTEMTLTGAPSPRVAPSGVWTGKGLLFFGGYNGRHFNETWFYSPSQTLYPYSKP